MLLHNLKMKPTNKIHRIRNKQRVERPRTATRRTHPRLLGDSKCMMMKKSISMMSSKKKNKRCLSKKSEMLKWHASFLMRIYNVKKMKCCEKL